MIRDLLRRLFDRDRNPDLPQVILIMGARRTGTTLLNQILCNAPDTNPHVGECQLLTRLVQGYAWSVENYDRVVQWYFDDPGQNLAMFRRSIEDFVRTSAAHFGNPRHLVLKNPQFSRYRAELRLLLPEARVVICLRNPFDQVVSELDVGARQTERSIDGNAARAARTRDVGALARRYMDINRGLLADVRGTELVVRYEDLIRDTAGTVRVLEVFTGLDLSEFNPAEPWKRFEHQDEIRKMPAYVEQYGAPLDRTRVDRFVEHLTAEEIARIAEICAPLLREYYPEHVPGQSSGEQEGTGR